MNNVLWIHGGQIIDPANDRNEMSGDVYAVDGKIVSDLNTDQKAKAKKIDASGLVVCPGFVDVHVHFREPGQTQKETIESGSWAAAAGGFTTVVCMPNTAPPCDNVGTIQLIQNVVERTAVVNVHTTGCLTVGRKGSRLAPIGSLKKAGVLAVSDDGSCVQNNEIMRRAVEYSSMFDLTVMDHCQDASLTQEAVINEGEWSLKLGLRGWPNAAEDMIVARNVILSLYSGAHIHMQHISSAYSVDIIRQAKQRGIGVTAEVTPHHLALTDARLHHFNSNFKMNPPLRTEEDRQALIEGLLDGTLDIIATDHAPHTNYEKDVELDYAPFGIIGLETALAIALETLVKPKYCNLSFLINLLTHKPSKLLKLNKGTLSPGADADITVFDPNESWTLTPDLIFSHSKNSPWIHKILNGRVKTTVVEGTVIFDGEKVFSKI